MKKTIKPMTIENNTDVCRLNMDRYEYNLLVKMINELKLSPEDFNENSRFEGFGFCIDSLLDKIENIKQISLENKRIATHQANEAKRERSKTKIEDTVKMIKINNGSITISKVAKLSGTSYNTAKKYLKLINELK